MTSNEKLFDDFVRQQVNIQRMSSGEVNRLLRTLNAADEELTGKIVSRLKMLKKSGRSMDFTTKRYQAMIKELRKTRASVIKAIGKDIGQAMNETVKIEIASSISILKNSVPVSINFASPGLTATRELVRDMPFGGANAMQTLEQWVTGLTTADSNRIVSVLQAGMLQGETIPQIEQRLMMAQNMTKQNVDVIARTGINHASNTARGEVFKENSDVLQALRWTSTLDGRTSPVCRYRSGRFGPADGTVNMEGVPQPHLEPPDATPPAHPRCRSLKIPILDTFKIGDALPDRPTVRDIRTGRKRQIDFEKRARADARAEGKRWSELTGKQKSPYRRGVRQDWARKNVGTVPGETTYNQWLRRQDAGFQDSVLGKTKGKMYRDNPDMTMANFVDRRGNELTLAELAKVSPS